MGRRRRLADTQSLCRVTSFANATCAASATSNLARSTTARAAVGWSSLVKDVSPVVAGSPFVYLESESSVQTGPRPELTSAITQNDLARYRATY